MEQRLCPQCDSPCDAEARFCRNCGAAMATGLPVAEQTAPANLVLTPNPSANPAAPVQLQGMAPASHQQLTYQQVPQQPVQPGVYQQPYQPPQYSYPQAPLQQVNVVVANNALPMMIVKQKSVGVALLLTFLFGPLGMFYSTVSGAVIMLVVSVVLAIFTLGISVFITWPICMIWGAIAASEYNKTIITRT